MRASVARSSTGLDMSPKNGRNSSTSQLKQNRQMLIQLNRSAYNQSPFGSKLTKSNDPAAARVRTIMSPAGDDQPELIQELIQSKWKHSGQHSDMRIRVGQNLTKTQSQQNFMQAHRGSDMAARPERPLSMVRQRANLLSGKENRPATGYLKETSINEMRRSMEEPLLAAQKASAFMHGMAIYEDKSSAVIKVADIHSEALEEANRYGFDKVRGSACPAGSRNPRDTLTKKHTNASTNMSRPQTGDTTAFGVRASKARSVAHVDNCGDSSKLLKNRRGDLNVESNEFLVKNLGAMRIPQTVSHKSIGGGLMSKKRRDRNRDAQLRASYAKMSQLEEYSSVQHEELIVESRNYAHEFTASETSPHKSGLKILESSYYRGNSKARSPDAHAAMSYKNILAD